MATMLLRIIVLSGLFIINISPCKGQPPSAGGREVWNEGNLITHLMAGYVKEARPVLKQSDHVSVRVKFSFVRIEDLDEASDTFTSSLLIVQMWKDPRLRWNISDYGGVVSIKLPAKRLWIPDLVLYNVAHKTPPESLYEETVTVTSDGNVVWVPMLKLYSTCPMDLRDFPFDVQTCNLVFGSWMHTSWEMNVTFISREKELMDVTLSEEDSSYPVHKHPQWELVDNRAQAKLTQKKYECCPQPFTLITITVQLRRRPQFYSLLTVGPAAAMGLLVPIIYLVPPRRQDKTIFGLLLLLSMAVLLTIIQQAIPFNHWSVPKICSFYVGTMILTVMSVIASVVVTSVCSLGAKRRPLPAWIRGIFLGRRGLRRLLCIGNYEPLRNLYASDFASPVSEMRLQEVEGDQLMESIEPLGLGNNGERDKQLAHISRCLKYMVGKMSADVTYENINQEWEELGCVIDRTLFLMFVVLYIFIASTLL